jgi:hypothetical protein
VRIRIVRGSDGQLAEWTSVVKEAIKLGFKKMTGVQITGTIVVGILLGTGYCTFSKWQDTKLDAMKAQIEATVRERSELHDERLLQKLGEHDVNLLNKFGDFARNLQQREANIGRDVYKPVRGYLKSLESDEEISVNGGHRYGKKEALKMLDAIPQPIMQYVHGDGVYVLQRIELLNGKQTIGIMQPEQKPMVTALLTRLDENVQSSLLQTVKESMETNSQRMMELQIDIYFTAKGIQYAAVVGVGKARPDMRHYSFEDIPAGVDPQDARLPGEQ